MCYRNHIICCLRLPQTDMSLCFLFIVLCICGCPRETESWRALAIHFSGSELTCFLSEHSHFKCSLIKILLLIYSLKRESELIWHVFEGGKLGEKNSVFSANSRNGTNYWNNDISSVVLVKSTSDLISQNKSRKISNNLHISDKIFLDTWE